MLRLLIGSLITLSLSSCMAACSQNNAQAIGPYMDALRQANARGHLSFSAGGSPLTAGAKQVFFLGPENVSIAFDGDVDFTRPGNP